MLQHNRNAFMSPRLAVLLTAIFCCSHADFASAEQSNQIRFPTSDELLSTLKRAEELIVTEKYDDALDLYMKALEIDRTSEKESNRLVEIKAKLAEIEVKRGDRSVKMKQWVLAEKLEKPKASPFNRSRRGSAPSKRFVPRRLVGLTQFIQARLLALPDNVISIYQERFDYRAKAALAEAIEAGNLKQIDCVYQRFILSKHAIDALEYLAEMNFNTGNVGESARLYETLAQRHRWLIDNASRTNYMNKALVAWAFAGEVEKVNQLSRELGKTGGKLGIDLGTRSLTIEQLLVQASTIRAAAQKVRSQGLTQIMGDVAHTNSFPAALGIGPPRFEMVYFNQPRQSSTPSYNRAKNNVRPTIIQALRRRVDLSGQSIRELQPCALLSTGSQVVTHWLSDGLPGPKVYSPTRENYNRANDKIIHGGSANHGVYVTSFVMRVKDRKSFRNIPITVDQPVRKLCALDTKRWRWLWNHEDILKKTRFRNASFLAPPIIVGDTVYAPAILIEGFIQSYVMAFDLKTGAIKWATWVCSGQVEQTMFGEHAREPLVSPLTYQNGKIYHCSSLGAVASIDARTGTPDWVTTYDQINIKPPKGFFPRPREIAWANNPPIISNGILVVTPLDSELVIAYNTLSGKQLWIAKQGGFNQAGKLEYLLGVSANRVVLTARNKIEVLDLKSGRVVAEHRLRNRIVGRGLIANNFICISLNGSGARRIRATSHVAIFDLRQIVKGSLKLFRSDPLFRNVGGDLLMFDDTVLMLQQGRLSAYKNQVPKQVKKKRRSQDF